MPDPGYYSSLFQDMLEINKDQREGTLQQERQQKIAIEKNQMALQNQERSLMMQAFQGGGSARSGMQDATDLDAKAKNLEATATRLMSRGFMKDGLALQREADHIRSQKGAQDTHNIQNAIRLNELRGEISMTVNDQSSLDQAIQDLTKAGIPPPPLQYRKWGTPETAKYWEGMARTSKRYLDDLRVKDQELGVKLKQDELDRKTAKDKADAEEKDRKDALARYKVLQKELPDEPGIWASDEKKKAYKDRAAEVEAARKAAFGGAVKPPAASGKFETGKVYVDANGNRAKWNGTDWEPQ